MHTLELLAADADAMEAQGARLARCCPPGILVFLDGNLGAGKTTLARGFLRARGHTGAVRSPTYTLVEPYELPTGAVYHFDLYRLSDPEELEFLGVREFFGEAVCLVEWPERGLGWLPAPDLSIHIEPHQGGRRLRLTAQGARGEAVLACVAAG